MNSMSDLNLTIGNGFGYDYLEYFKTRFAYHSFFLCNDVVNRLFQCHHQWKNVTIYQGKSKTTILDSLITRINTGLPGWIHERILLNTWFNEFWGPGWRYDSHQW